MQTIHWAFCLPLAACGDFGQGRIAVNLWLRLAFTILRALLGASLEPLATARTPFRVWPHDLDINRHMNNGRYATLMDLGRVDLMIRSGVAGAVLRARMHPVVTAQHITYRRALGPFERFTIETRVTGWDERCIYLAQRFVRASGEVAAEGKLETLFLDWNGRVPTDRVIAVMGVEDTLALPEDMRRLFPGRSEPRAARSTVPTE